MLTLDLGRASIQDWVWTLRNINAENLTMIKTYGGQMQGGIVDGTWYEPLEPSLVDLLKAARADTVVEFLASHQDWVADDATAGT
jgi:hypothetical protein